MTAWPEENMAMVAQAAELAKVLVKTLRKRTGGGKGKGLETAYACAFGLVAICQGGAREKDDWPALAMDIINNAIEFAKVGQSGPGAERPMRALRFTFYVDVFVPAGQEAVVAAFRLRELSNYMAGVPVEAFSIMPTGGITGAPIKWRTIDDVKTLGAVLDDATFPAIEKIIAGDTGGLAKMWKAVWKVEERD